MQSLLQYVQRRQQTPLQADSCINNFTEIVRIILLMIRQYNQATVGVASLMTQ